MRQTGPMWSIDPVRTSHIAPFGVLGQGFNASADFRDN